MEWVGRGASAPGRHLAACQLQSLSWAARDVQALHAQHAYSRDAFNRMSTQVTARVQSTHSRRSRYVRLRGCVRKLRLPQTLRSGTCVRDQYARRRSVRSDVQEAGRFWLKAAAAEFPERAACRFAGPALPDFAAATRRPRRNDGHDKPQRLRMRSYTGSGLELKETVFGGVHS
jgi:hypothetical protein